MGMGNRSIFLLRAKADTTTTMLTFGVWIGVHMKLFCLTTGSSKSWTLFFLLVLLIVMGPVMLLGSEH
jgi:hypothetical protein